MKRLFDIVASGLGLIVLSPLFIVLAIWIKLDSKGPVFYRQVLPLDEKDWIQTIQTYQQLDKQEIKGLSSQIKYSVKHNFSLEAMHAQYNEIYKIIAK